jgi:hypothetical protein
MARALLGPVVIAGMILLAACTPTTPVATSSPSPDPTESATPEPTTDPDPRTFAPPADCVSLLPSTRLSAFETAGLQLLGGPGGLYGEDYLSEPTPEERAGGITCIWGDEAAPESMITVSVAPVTLANRGTIVNDLLAQGLNETATDEALTYGELGDEVSAPAILNVVRQDSWISVITAHGGDGSFAAAQAIADEVAAAVYPSD